MGNIIGNNPEHWAKNQIDLRQQLLGRTERTSEILAWQTTKTAWIRAASSVYIQEGTKITEKDASGETVEREIKKSTELTGDPKYRGRNLAKEYVLFNGTVGIDSSLNEEGDALIYSKNLNFTQKSGISTSGSNINQNVYGFGGTSRGLLPMPGIVDLNVNTLSRGSLRKAELKLKAYNREQFQILDTLYMRPGYTILVEWGHTQYFKGSPENYEYTTANFNTTPFNTLMSLNEVVEEGSKPSQDDILAQIKNERIESDGNYDGFYGKVTNFNWNLNSDGSYDITVFAISIGDVIESLTINTTLANYEEPKPTDNSGGGGTDSSQWYYFDLTDGKGSYTRRVKQGTQKQYREYWRDVEGFEDANNDNLFDSVTTEFSTFKKKYPSTMNSYTLKRPADYVAPEPTPDGVLITQKARSLFNAWLYSQHVILDNLLTTSTTEDVGTTSLSNPPKIKYFRDDDFLVIQSQVSLPIIDGGSGAETGRTKRVISKNNPYQYIKLGTLLGYIERNLLIYGGNLDPFIKFDYSMETEGDIGNYCYTHPDQFSSDPMVCIIPFKGRKSSDPTDLAYDFFDKIAGTDFRNPKSNFVGNLMHIWVNINHVATTLDRCTQNGAVPLLSFLETLIMSIQDSLGNVNKFSVTYDHDENLVIIRDDIPLDPAVTNISPAADQRALFNVYGWKPKEQNGSFVTNVGISSTLSNQFATMISIGAQARSTSDISNATAFSRWNEGLIDVVTPQKLSKAAATQTAEQQKKPLDIFKENLKELYKSGMVLGSFYCRAYEPSQDGVEATRSINSSFANFLTTYYNKEFKAPSSQGFIPFNMSLTMEGFSGMRIYEKFYTTTEILPPSYPESLQFLVKGLRHSIGSQGWITSIESMAMQSVDEPALKTPMNVTITQEDPQIDPDSETPNADKLRKVLEELGYLEKGEEISNGGDISEKLYKYSASVFRKIKELVPSVTVKVTGGNDAYHQNLSYTSSHSLGDGLDFVITPLTQANKNAVDQILGGFAAGNADQTVSFINEYDHPSSAATAGHFHIRIGGKLEGSSRVRQYYQLAMEGKIESYPIA